MISRVRPGKQLIAVERDDWMETYQFSRVFGPCVRNIHVFEEWHGPTWVTGLFRGVSETIVAYGAQSSGKTHTFFGSATEPGLLHLFAGAVFARARESPSSRVSLACYAVTDHVLTDLLGADVTPCAFPQVEVFLKTRKYTYKIMSVHDEAHCINLVCAAQLRNADKVSKCPHCHAMSHMVVHLFIRNPIGNSIASGVDPVLAPPVRNECRGILGVPSPCRSTCTRATHTSSVMTFVDLAGMQQISDGRRGSNHQRCAQCKSFTPFTPRGNSRSITLSSQVQMLANIAKSTCLDDSWRRQSGLNKCIWEHVQQGSRVKMLCCVGPCKPHRDLTRSMLLIAEDVEAACSSQPFRSEGAANPPRFPPWPNRLAPAFDNSQNYGCP